MTQTKIAEMIGKTQAYVEQRVKIYILTPESERKAKGSKGGRPRTETEPLTTEELKLIKENNERTVNNAKKKQGAKK